MSVTGFWLDETSGAGVEDQINSKMALVNAATYTQGDALQISVATSNYGMLVAVPAQNSAGQFVFLAMKNAPEYLRAATYGLPSYNEAGLVLDVDKTSLVFWNQVAAATYDDTAAAAQATGNTTVKWVGVGTTLDTDFLGGTIYIPELAQQGIITAMAVSGGTNGTYTATVSGVVSVRTKYPVAPPSGGTAGGFSQNVTTGNTIRVVPYGPGYRGGVKFQATNPQQGVSVAIADITGGCLYIWDVQLADRKIYVRFDSSLI